MIKLGQTVEDKVTGFMGIATAKTEYLNGCVQILVRPKAAKPKKDETQQYPDGTYIDIEQLRIVKGSKILKVKKFTVEESSGGGLRLHPKNKYEQK